MKHTLIFALVAICIGALAVVSCENAFTLTYDFNITGHATGDVSVAFPGGSVDLDGATNLAFKYGNLDTTKLNQPKLSMRQTKKIYQMAENDVFCKFSATAAEGTYYLNIDCVVREECTGAEIRWQKILTNEPQPTK